MHPLPTHINPDSPLFEAIPAQQPFPNCPFVPRFPNAFPPSNVDDEYLQYCKTTHGPIHFHTLITTVRLAREKIKQRQLNDAKDLYLEAILGYQQHTHLGCQVIATVCHDLCIVQALRGDYQSAMKLHSQAFRGLSAVVGRQSPRLFELINTMGLIFGLQDKKMEAERLFKAAFEGFEATIGLRTDTTLHCGENWAKALKLKSHTTTATQLHKRINDNGHHHSNQFHAICLIQNVANASFCNKQPDEAGRWIESVYHCLKYAREGPEYTLLLDCYNTLGLVYTDYDYMEQAEACFNAALKGKEELFGDGHPSTLQTVHNMGYMYAMSGRREEARAMYQRRTEGKDALGIENGGEFFVRVRLLDQFNESIQDSFVFLASHDLLPDPEMPEVKRQEESAALEQLADYTA